MDFPSADTLFLKREFELCKSEFIAKSDKLFLNCLCHRNSLILTIHPYIIFLLACCKSSVTPSVVRRDALFMHSV